ncbi:hypothetical protein pdam_00025347 [Pocillopora damicornis]|uniref:Uncharacterized protein n=1 Tax=Pocillopora damicornis TaxID=46731 RepID=A0A3M6TYY2_POCDA|nr:hypothetical protein pdam_00025347 [Pocillopora damicornis]
MEHCRSSWCRYCRGAHINSWEVGDPPSDIETITSEIPVSTEVESMDQTAGPSQEQRRRESPETTEDEFVLPRSRMQFRDEIGSEGDPNSDILSPSSQESLVGVETSHEWQPAPQVEHQLRYLKSYLMESTDGRISPVRSQCKSDVMTISSSSQRYYRKKASQAVNTVLNAIALGNLSWLLQKLSKSTIADELSLLLLKRTS